MPMYVCSRCGHSHSVEEFTESRFCRNCKKFLTHQDRRSADPKDNGEKTIHSVEHSRKRERQTCPICGKKLKDLIRHLSIVHNLKNMEQLRDAIEKSQRVTKKYAVQENLLRSESYWDALIAKRLSGKGDESASVGVPRSDIPKGKWKWKYERIVEYVDASKTPFTSREVADYAGCPITSVKVVFSKIGKDFIAAVGKAKHDVRLLLYDKTSKWDKDQALSRYRNRPPGTTTRPYVPIRDVALGFEKCKEQLKEDLKLSQEVVNRTLTLIEEYQPFFDEETKHMTRLPRYLQPEIVIGACLYLACEEKGSNISQFNIAKAQGHYDNNALNRAVREIRAKRASKMETNHEKARREGPRRNHKLEEKHKLPIPNSYAKIIGLIAKASSVSLRICRAEHPEIEYDTFDKVLRILSEYNLVESLPMGGGRIMTVYRKTKKFTIEKATELFIDRPVNGMRKPVDQRSVDTLDVEETTQDQRTTSPKPLIGFIALHENPSENSFIEAILVTDRNGYPIEYRFTEKIRISETQRILYGETLRSYLALEAFGPKLLEKLDNPPTLIVAKDEELLALREKSECPILLLEAEGVSLRTHKKYPHDAESTRSVLKSYKERISLSKPFERISKLLLELE